VTPSPSTTRNPPGRWLELAVNADPEAVEAVSEILGRVAGSAISVEPAFELVEDGLGARIDPSKPAVVRAYLAADTDGGAVARAVDEVEIALGHLQAFGLRPIGELATRTVDETDWAEAWKANFPVLRVGRRLVIRPTWRHHRARPDDVVVALDPGMAFGTGLHPTTRLCLAALEGLADGGAVSADDRSGGRLPARDLRAGGRVLDVGCGSGILAIAAARLGARRVLGVDTDPIAVEATAANAELNGLGALIEARHGSLPTGAGPFDVVLANLIASLLVELAPALRDELRPGGILLASGIFVDREAEVRGAFEAAGLAVDDRTADGDWVALRAVRR
jgi:ribosomal protein L11 methyltransferase